MEIIDTKYLTYGELEEILKNLKDTEDIRNLKEYVRTFKKLDLEKEKELIEKLKSLEISKVKISEELIYMIVNIYPKNKDVLRAILKYSRIPFSEEEINKILEVINSI